MGRARTSGFDVHEMMQVGWFIFTEEIQINEDDFELMHFLTFNIMFQLAVGMSNYFVSSLKGVEDRNLVDHLLFLILLLLCGLGEIMY